MDAAAYTFAGPSIKRFLLASAALHALLIAWTAFSILYAPAHNVWSGAGGDVVPIGLVRGVAGVPLPRPEMATSQAVDDTKGLYKAEPVAKPLPDNSAKQLPEFEKNKPPRYVTRPSKVFENRTPPPSNAVPYGEGGTPALPYTQFTMSNGSQGGIGMGGPGGDFGARYPWYVEAVRRRVSANWLQSAIDPAIRVAPRVVIAFQIMRDGTATSIQITRSSGNSSVDTSAIRAVRDANPLERLPSDYQGGSVGVEFWFEFRRSGY